jgi:hypothetical protein
MCGSAVAVPRCVPRDWHARMNRTEPGQNAESDREMGEMRGADAQMRPGKLVGRSQAARLLGVSKSTVRRMEGQTLTPIVGPKNMHLFHEEQVQSLIVTRRSETGCPPRATGDIAADVFELFDENLHPVEVVKRLRIEPGLVETLHQHWCRLRGLLVLSTVGTTELHDILCVDEFAPPTTSEAELIALAQKWVIEESQHQCKRCRGESAAFCRPCAKAWGARAAQSELAAQRARRL